MRVLIASVFVALYLAAQGQKPEIPGMPPRASAADYQANAQAGSVTIGAEFLGHSVPTEQGTLSTEEYVVIETGLFGPADTRVKLSAEDFSLRINGKKAVPSQPYGLVVRTVKDPEWETPASAAAKSKTSIGGAGGGRGKGDPDGPPAPTPVPIAVRRAAEQRVQKAALPEGDRALPQAGFLFFQYRGKTQGIHSIELVYSGSAGKALLALRP
jgi:hypothetical protein